MAPLSRMRLAALFLLLTLAGCAALTMPVPAHDLATPASAAVLLSTLGAPWLALAGRRRTGLRSRLVLFAWTHPGWAACLRWTAALLCFGAEWALAMAVALAVAVALALAVPAAVGDGRRQAVDGQR